MSEVNCTDLFSPVTKAQVENPARTPTIEDKMVQRINEKNNADCSFKVAKTPLRVSVKTLMDAICRSFQTCSGSESCQRWGMKRGVIDSSIFSGYCLLYI